MPPRKPLAGRRPTGGRRLLWRPEARGRAKPCRRRTLRLGRRPTVQLQSTRTADFSKHTRLHPYVLLDMVYLSHSFYILLSVSLCLSLPLPHTDSSLSHTQKGEETETV